MQRGVCDRISSIHLRSRSSGRQRISAIVKDTTCAIRKPLRAVPWHAGDSFESGSRCRCLVACLQLRHARSELCRPVRSVQRSRGRERDRPQRRSSYRITVLLSNSSRLGGHSTSPLCLEPRLPGPREWVRCKVARVRRGSSRAGETFVRAAHECLASAWTGLDPLALHAGAERRDGHVAQPLASGKFGGVRSHARHQRSTTGFHSRRLDIHHALRRPFRSIRCA